MFNRKHGKRFQENGLTKQELNKALNFMLQNGIIDIQQYNDLLIKSLPYAK